MEAEAKKRIVEFFLSKGMLVTAGFMEGIEKEGAGQLGGYIEGGSQNQALILGAEASVEKKAEEVDWAELEKSKAISEKRRDTKAYDKFLEYLKEKEPEKAEADMEVAFSYREKSRAREVSHFVGYFNSRYNAIERMLRGKTELQQVISINRVLGKKERERAAIIGIVNEKRITKNQNLLLTVEDNTGEIKVLVSKNKPGSYNEAKDIVLDEVIGVVGTNGDNILFANSIIWPDTHQRELKKSEEEIYACFISDLHVGSSNFLEEELNKFLKWARGEIGSEQQRGIASKLRYVFIAGDLVDGVGVYPDQDYELAIKDIYEQYRACAGFISQIPKHIKVIICPGNHDAVRIAEPQPELREDFTKPLQELPNVTLVSNPAVVRIGKKGSFAGFEVLLYHGYSFDYYIANVEGIRSNGGYDRADLIMKFLLKRRHLSPSHTATLYIPDPKKDSLVIESTPDFFATGHIHKSAVAQYRATTMICGSCWQSKTAFQEKMGHHPEPGLVPVVNLKTRKVKIMRF